MAIHLLQPQLPVSLDDMKKGLSAIQLPGRLQVLPGAITRIYDVAHNKAAILNLAKYLQERPIAGKTFAVFSMLADKDIAGCIDIINDNIDEWHVGALNVERGANLSVLKRLFDESGVVATNFHENVTSAYVEALTAANAGDRVVVFGSFHTIALCWDAKS